MGAVGGFIIKNQNIEILYLPDPTITEEVPRLQNTELLQKLHYPESSHALANYSPFV
jgi:hypothetical protein